ncbi:MAG: MATE family efflux transporter [Eubacteriales bacterium]|nr:MATE family efflux transporter [Eubacteriales bacterium]
MNRKNKLAAMPVRPLLYTMAAPLMLSLLIQSLYNIVDSIFVARLSETALTAASLVYAVQFLMIAVGVGTAVGLNSLLSRKIGEKKTEEACRAATTGLFLMLLTSLIFTLIGLLFSDSIAAMLAPEPELQELCRQYLSVNLVFCWGIFLQTYGQRLLQAVGDTVLSMVSLIIGAVLNVILDPIMIFGLLGCPQMGIRGAAIATVIGQMAGAVAALLFNRLKNPVIHVRFKGYRFLWEDVADIYRVGLPTILMQAIGSFMTFAVNQILLGVSATAVAFFGVYYKLQNFLMMPVNGLGQAAIPVTGYNYGSKQYERVSETWKVLIPTGVIFALCGTAVFLIFPKQLLSLFSASSEMLEFGVPALRIISVTFVFAVTTILCGYFASGLGNGVINMVSGAIRQLLVLVPCLWIFIKTLGINRAWFAFWIAEIAAFLYSYQAAKKEMRKKTAA